VLPKQYKTQTANKKKGACFNWVDGNGEKNGNIRGKRGEKKHAQPENLRRGRGQPPQKNAHSSNTALGQQQSTKMV